MLLFYLCYTSSSSVSFGNDRLQAQQVHQQPGWVLVDRLQVEPVIQQSGLVLVVIVAVVAQSAC